MCTIGVCNESFAEDQNDEKGIEVSTSKSPPKQRNNRKRGYREERKKEVLEHMAML